MKEPRPGSPQGALSLQDKFSKCKMYCDGNVGLGVLAVHPRRVSHMQQMWLGSLEEVSSRTGHHHLLLQSCWQTGSAPQPRHQGRRVASHTRFLSSLSLSSLLSFLLSPAVPWSHQISEGLPASNTTSVPALRGLNF